MNPRAVHLSYKGEENNVGYCIVPTRVTPVIGVQNLVKVTLVALNLL